MRQTGGMPDLLGPGQRLLTPLLGLIGIAQSPEDLRQPGEVGDPEMIPTTEGRGGGLRRVAEGQTLLEMGPSR